MDKVEIYDECMYKRFHDPKFEPVIRCMYQVIKHYNREITKSSKTIESLNRNKKDFINKILALFEKLVDNGEYNDLYNTIQLLFSLKLDSFDFINYLYLFYLKEDSYNYNTMEFYRKIKELCYLIRRYNTFEKSDTYLFQLINSYLANYDKIQPMKPDCYWKIRSFLDNYGSILVSICYLKYDINDFEEIINKVINNFEDIETYFLLNGIDSAFKEIDLSDRLDFVTNIINNKRKIKVIE